MAGPDKVAFDEDAFFDDMRSKGVRVVEYTTDPAQTIDQYRGQYRDDGLIYGAASPADALRRANARDAAKTAAAGTTKRKR